mmetsp:Transcript_45183/g.104269  ORF Transcript_45183/g.104269 Transcript_45183/m.104269 type:complete len:290 (+) Transcript_45183:657-1526(+)
MMSSLSSNFNSASTIFTVDVYHRFLRPDASERELLWCGRIATAATCVIALLWLPVLSQQRGEFYLIVQNASSHIAPALATVVLLGIMWPRVNSRAAFAGLLSGSVLGLAAYGVNLAFEHECRAAVVGTTIGGPQLACMNFLHVAVLLSAVTLAVTVPLTLVGTPPPTSVTRDTTVQWATCLWASRPDSNLSPHVQMADHDHDHTEDCHGLSVEHFPAAAAAPAAVPREVAVSWTRVATPPALGSIDATVSVKPTRDASDWVDSNIGQVFVHVASAALIVIVAVLVVVFR